MGNEAATLPITERTPSPYTFDTVETLHDIVSAAERIMTTGVERVALVTIRLYYEKEYKFNSFRSGHAHYSTNY